MKSLLFQDFMIWPILDGHKTQTRRLHRKAEPGDIVYTREAWRVAEPEIYGPDCIQYRPGLGPDTEFVKHFAKGALRNLPLDGRWRSPLHLPEKLARLFLRVEEVHSEPLAAISENDAMLEGIALLPCGMWRNYLHPEHGLESAVDSFHSLWNAIHGGASFEKNPRVYVHCFREVAHD